MGIVRRVFWATTARSTSGFTICSRDTAGRLMPNSQRSPQLWSRPKYCPQDRPFREARHLTKFSQELKILKGLIRLKTVPVRKSRTLPTTTSTVGRSGGRIIQDNLIHQHILIRTITRENTGPGMGQRARSRGPNPGSIRTMLRGPRRLLRSQWRPPMNQFFLIHFSLTRFRGGRDPNWPSISNMNRSEG